MRASPPELILFDLGNVLLNFDHEIAVRNMAELSGASIDDVREAVFGAGLQWRFELGEIDGQEFCTLFRKAVKREVDYHLLCRACSDIFTLNASIVPIVAQLRAAGHRLGILSNTCEAHWEFVTDGRYTILPGYFDVIALSYEIRAMKPDERAFRVTSDLARTRPEAIFYMDDRPENVEAALAVGYDAIVYTDAHSLASELRARGVRFNY